MIKSRVRVLNQINIKNRIVVTPQNRSSINQKTSTLSLSRDYPDSMLEENSSKYTPKKYISKTFTTTPPSHTKSVEKGSSGFESEPSFEKVLNISWNRIEVNLEMEKKAKQFPNGSHEFNKDISEKKELKKLKKIQSMLINSEESDSKYKKFNEVKLELNQLEQRSQRLSIELQNKNNKITQISGQLAYLTRENLQLIEKNQKAFSDIIETDLEKKDLISINNQLKKKLSEMEQSRNKQKQQIQSLKNQRQKEIFQIKQMNQEEIKQIKKNYEYQNKRLKYFYDEIIHQFELEVKRCQQTQINLEEIISKTEEEVQSLLVLMEDKQIKKQIKQVQTDSEILLVDEEQNRWKYFFDKINEIAVLHQNILYEKLQQIEQKVKDTQKMWGKAVTFFTNKIQTNTSIVLDNDQEQTSQVVEIVSNESAKKSFIEKFRAQIEERDREIFEYETCIEQYRGLVIELKRKVEDQETIEQYYYEILQIFDIDQFSDNIHEQLIKMINKLAIKVGNTVGTVEQLERRIEKLENDKQQCLKNIKEQKLLVTCAIKAKVEIEKKLTFKTQQQEKLIAQTGQLQSLVKSLNQSIILKELQKLSKL